MTCESEKDAARQQGFRDAIEALRECQRQARYGADRAVMKIAADYLDSVVDLLWGETKK